MEGGNHPWNHRVREPSGILSFCYFLVLIWSGERREGRAFSRAAAHERATRNRHPGQRITSRVPMCPGSSLIYKKTKKKEREKNREGGKKRKKKRRKNELALWRLFDEDRSGLKALPSRLLFSTGSPWNFRFVSRANSFKDRRAPLSLPSSV